MGGYSYKVWSMHVRYKFAMKQSRYINQNNEYSDILEKYKTIFGNNNSDSFVEPLEGTYSDFNTYYGNLIRKEIGNEISTLFLEVLNKQISKDSFMVRNYGEIFEDLEKLYFYDNLANELNFSLDYDLVKSQYEKNHQNYYIEIQENIDKLQDIQDSKEIEYELSILWSQLYYASYLEQKYGTNDFVELIDWTMKLLDNDAFLSLTSYKFKLDTISILNINEESPEPLNVSSILELITDLQDVYSYSEMVENGYDKAIFDSNYIEQLHENLLLSDFTDLQETYFQIKILTNLNEPISSEIKEHLNNKFLIYQYDNETLPVITKIVPSMKQLMMTNSLCNMIVNEKCIDVINLNLGLITEENMDSMDLYAKYIFGYILNNNVPKDEDLIREFSNGRNYFDSSNITQLSYYLKTKKVVSKTVDIEDISFDFEKYFDSLDISSSNITLQDLILLDSLSNISTHNIPNEIVEKIRVLQFDPTDELFSFKFTYLYKILFKYEHDLEKLDELNKDFNKFTDLLRFEGGYKQTESDSFANLQLTYLILETISSFSE